MYVNIVHNKYANMNAHKKNIYIYTHNWILSMNGKYRYLSDMHTKILSRHPLKSEYAYLNFKHAYQNFKYAK